MKDIMHSENGANLYEEHPAVWAILSMRRPSTDASATAPDGTSRATVR